MQKKIQVKYPEIVLFRMGMPVTYGSYTHNTYTDIYIKAEKYLIKIGFFAGNFLEISERIFGRRFIGRRK